MRLQMRVVRCSDLITEYSEIFTGLTILLNRSIGGFPLLWWRECGNTYKITRQKCNTPLSFTNLIDCYIGQKVWWFLETLRQWSRTELQNNEGQLRFPTYWWNILLLRQLHNNMGHPGRDRTTSLLIDRFYWLTMKVDTTALLEECNKWLKF